MIKKISVSALSHLIERKTSHRPLIIGIDGPGGSGKSHLGRLLAGEMSGADIVSTDEFYTGSLPPKQIVSEYHGFDLGRIKSHVLAHLKEGRGLRYQPYDWHSGSLGQHRTLTPSNTVIIEGVYTLKKELRGFYDVAIWVETPRAVRLNRGLERDGEDARTQWEDEWMPLEDSYIDDPTENPGEHADLIISGNSMTTRRSTIYVEVTKSRTFTMPE